MIKKVDTVVEVFDTVNLQNNIMAATVFRAESIIFLYESRQEDSMEGVCAFLQAKRPQMRMDKVLVSAKNAREIVRNTLQALKSDSKEVLVEINGGNPIIANYARTCCRELKFPCIALDALSGEIVNIEHAEGLEGAFSLPELTFSDILLLQGRTYNRNMHMLAEERYHDRILTMSEYVFSHPADFKFFYDFVHHKSDGELSEPGLTIILKKSREISERLVRIFELFVNQGFIKDLVIEEHQIRFTCVALFVKEMLAVKGSWLEMYVYIHAKRSGLFSEVYQSVMIGWDLQKRPQFNVENEIDVVLMKQGIPIFISCKLTNPKPDALNEIFALASSFGGYGAVPALATSSDVRNRNRTLYNRAEEMGVTLLDASVLNKEGMMKFFEKISK